MSDGGIWDQYWHYDRIASCFDDAGATNYEDCVAKGWRAFFHHLPAGTKIIDLCTGNGAAALIAAQVGRGEAKHFEIVAVDRADIDPPFYVTRHAEDYAAVAFHGRTEIEALPFPDSSFGAAVSQYGIEYSDLARSLPEAARVIAPGGRLRVVVHAADGGVAAGAHAIIAEADLLLDEIDLAGCAARCFEAVLAVEREPDAGGEAKARADRDFAAFQNALERTALHIPGAADKAMFRNSGAVLLDSFSRRGCFDLAQLLAKTEEVRGEIACHRGRLAALLEAALDEAGSQDMADRLREAGAEDAGCAPLRNDAGLIAYVVEARF